MSKQTVTQERYLELFRELAKGPAKSKKLKWKKLDVYVSELSLPHKLTLQVEWDGQKLPSKRNYRAYAFLGAQLLSQSDWKTRKEAQKEIVQELKTILADILQTLP